MMFHNLVCSLVVKISVSNQIELPFKWTMKILYHQLYMQVHYILQTEQHYSFGVLDALSSDAQPSY
jgi:hypothetical protein